MHDSPSLVAITEYINNSPSLVAITEYITEYISQDDSGLICKIALFIADVIFGICEKVVPSFGYQPKSVTSAEMTQSEQNKDSNRLAPTSDLTPLIFGRWLCDH